MPFGFALVCYPIPRPENVHPLKGAFHALEVVELAGIEPASDTPSLHTLNLSVIPPYRFHPRKRMTPSAATCLRDSLYSIPHYHEALTHTLLSLDTVPNGQRGIRPCKGYNRPLTYRSATQVTCDGTITTSKKPVVPICIHSPRGSVSMVRLLGCGRENSPPGPSLRTSNCRPTNWRTRSMFLLLLKSRAATPIAAQIRTTPARSQFNIHCPEPSTLSNRGGALILSIPHYHEVLKKYIRDSVWNNISLTCKKAQDDEYWYQQRDSNPCCPRERRVS